MAEQAEYRLYKRKRITNPSDESIYVDIPVLYEARFKLMADQAQEFYVYFDNSVNSSRLVHTKRVVNTQDESMFVDVERIDEWSIKLMADQAQESTFVMTNTDPPPIQPDGSNNPSHELTHVVRFFNENNANIWVDVELIDELKIKCIQEQAQEYIWYMKHPDRGAPIDDPDVSYTVYAGYCDPSFELDSSESPYRIDPFSNIVNVNWEATTQTGDGVAHYYCNISISQSEDTSGENFPGAPGQEGDGPPDYGGSAQHWQYSTVCVLACDLVNQDTETFRVEGSPGQIREVYVLPNYLFGVPNYQNQYGSISSSVIGLSVKVSSMTTPGCDGNNSSPWYVSPGNAGRQASFTGQQTPPGFNSPEIDVSSMRIYQRTGLPPYEKWTYIPRSIEQTSDSSMGQAYRVTFICPPSLQHGTWP